MPGRSFSRRADAALALRWVFVALRPRNQRGGPSAATRRSQRRDSIGPRSDNSSQFPQGSSFWNAPAMCPRLRRVARRRNATARTASTCHAGWASRASEIPGQEVAAAALGEMGIARAVEEHRSRRGSDQWSDVPSARPGIRPSGADNSRTAARRLSCTAPEF
jgi:hypothetical protein